MKKALVALAILFSIVLLGLPWVLGVQTKAAYDAALQWLQGYGRVLDSSYERGWWVSGAAFTLDLSGCGQASADGDGISIRVRSSITHGPWILRSPRLLPSLALIETHALLPLSGTDPIRLFLAARLDLDLDAAGRGAARLPSLSFAPPGDGTQGRFVLVAGGPISQAFEKPDLWVGRLEGEGELGLPKPLLIGLLEARQRRCVSGHARPSAPGQETPGPSAPAQDVTTATATATATAQAHLAALLRNGWLVRDGEHLTAAVELADGLLTVNGKTVPLRWEGR